MRKIILSTLLCCALGISTFGATHKIPPEEPIATVTIPDKWRSKELGEGMEASSADGALRVLVVPAEGTKVTETMGEAMRYLRSISGITVNADSLKNEPGKLNGMDVRQITWQGKDKNGDVKISFTILFIAEKKPLLVAYWGSPNAEKKHQAELKEMLKSIKKA